MVAFPDEILQQIFAELEDQLPLEKWQMYGAQLDHQGSAALRNLCLVCRQFRRIAQPLLYQTVVIEGRDGAKNIETLLLRTLIENPQLGEQVRVVSLTDNVDHSAQVNILGEDASKEIIRSAMENLDLPPALKFLMKSMITRCGLATLIIAYMPYVQVVDCTIDHPRTPLLWLLSTSAAITKVNGFPFYERGFINLGDGQDEDIEDQEEDQDISKSTFANYRFPNLNEVRIRAVDDETQVQPAWLIDPLLLNPTLKILRIFGTAWFGDRIPQLDYPEEMNYNLEYLDIMQTFIDSEGLMIILTCCPNLKGISISLPDEVRHIPFEHPEDDFLLRFDEFGIALRENGKNLEEFSLSTIFYEEGFDLGHGRIGSLRELKSLRHLKLSKDSLIGLRGSDGPILRLSEVLPESIETLDLHWDGLCDLRHWAQYRLEPYNRDVYKLLLDGMPNLREIRMERRNDWDDGSDDDDNAQDEDVNPEEGYVNSGDEDDGSKGGDGGFEEYAYSKDAEWPAELHVNGWDVDIVGARLWEIRGRPACKRNIVTLSRKKI